MSDKTTLTTSAGAPVPDNQNSLTAGPRGPVLMQDYQLLEKLAHQNRERIPERVVHAKGWGAFGTLTVTHDITRVHQGQDLLRRWASRPPCWRASPPWRAKWARPTPSATCAALRSSSTPKKATGTWWATTRPVFFVRDPYKFPDFIHTQKRHPKTNLRSDTAMWDFWSLSPESLHQVTILMSDRGLPDRRASHQRLRQPHLQLYQRRQRALLGQVPLQDPAGPQALDQRRGREVVGAHPRDLPRKTSSTPSSRATIPKWTLLRADHAGSRRREDRRTTPST